QEPGRALPVGDRSGRTIEPAFGSLAATARSSAASKSGPQRGIDRRTNARQSNRPAVARGKLCVYSQPIAEPPTAIERKANYLQHDCWRRCYGGRGDDDYRNHEWGTWGNRAATYCGDWVCCRDHLRGSRWNHRKGDQRNCRWVDCWGYSHRDLRNG